MSETVSPTLRRRRLGRQIRELRTSRGMSGEALARQIDGFNQSRLSKVEIGKATLDEAQLGNIITALNPTPEQAEEWQHLWREGNRLGWWSEYLDVINEHGELLAGFEADTRHCRQYIQSYVPTLEATEDYLEAVVSASQSIAPANTARVVEFRRLRQARLNDPDFRHTVVIGESALRQHIGGRAVMAHQLRSLLDTEWAATVEILVVPVEAGAYGAYGMSFQTMEFTSPDDPAAVFVERGPGGGTGFLEKPPEVRYYDTLFSVAQSRALNLERSRQRIEEIWEDMSK